jgi:hypothetical protein
MSNNDRQSQNSLEREFINEDIMDATGKKSKERRDEARKEKEKEEEAQRKADAIEASLNAGKRSKEKRNK